MRESEPEASALRAPPRATAMELGWRFVARLRSLTLVDALCLVVAALAVVALATAILHRYFDYDEMQHAYQIELVRRGDRPFYDFFECHPPYAWYPLSLLARAFGDSYKVLFALRLLSTAGHVVFLLYLGKNVALSLRSFRPAPSLAARWFVLGAVMVVVAPAVIDYVLEFRIDSWPNALLVFAIYRYRRKPGSSWRSSAVFAFLTVAAVLCSPKLVLFLALFVAADLVGASDRLTRIAGMAAGGIAALALGALLLLLARLNPYHVYKLAIVYHAQLAAKGGWGRGLAREVFGRPVLLGIVGAGALAWFVSARRRILQFPFELAMVGFLALQLGFVTFPYKQYYAPWFMLGAGLVPYLEIALRRTRVLHSVALAVAILYTADNAWEGRQRYEAPAARSDISYRQWMESVVPPTGFVMAPMETMPLYRRGPLYQLAGSFAPSGFDAERIARDLQLEPFSSRFTQAAFDRDMEANPPDLILVTGFYAPLQRTAIDHYFVHHRAEYDREQTQRGAVLVRKTNVQAVTTASPAPQPQQGAGTAAPAEKLP